MLKLNIDELSKQWEGKLVEVSRPCTPEEKEYYQCDTFGGIYEECYFFVDPYGIYISSESNLSQRLTEDTIIKLYVPPIDVPVKPLKSWM